MTKFTVPEDEIAGTRRDPPRVSKTLICEHTVGSTQISMGVNITEVNSRIPLHSHTDSEEAMYIIQGNGVLRAEGKEYELHPGTAIFSPRGVEHEIINKGDIPLKLVWAYAPPLPDHLRKK